MTTPHVPGRSDDAAAPKPPLATIANRRATVRVRAPHPMPLRSIADAGASHFPTTRPARDRHGHDRTTQRTRAAITQTSEVGKLLDLIRQQNIQVVDVKFCDLPGTWQHFSIPAATLDEDMIREGLGFDGSSIRGFQAINESDMLLIPDVSTAFVDPVLEVPTLSLTCDIYDPITLEPYSRDPALHRVQGRGVPPDHGHRHHVVLGARGGVLHLQLVRFDQNAHEAYYHIDAEEGVWNSGRNGGSPNLGHRPRHKEGYFPVPPVDRLQDVRSKIMLALIEAGVPVEVQHHEVATAGQAEIDFKFGTAGADRRPADGLQVRGQERLPQPGLHGHVHAQAAVRRQRLGHARAPVTLEGRLRRSSTTRTATRCSRRRRGTTSAASSPTRRRCWRSARRPPTATGGWCPASRRRST